MEMKNKDIHLTFKTDIETHVFLREFAHIQGKTQPELINEICIDFKKKVLKHIKENKQNSNIDTN